LSSSFGRIKYLTIHIHDFRFLLAMSSLCAGFSSPSIGESASEHPLYS
jgi:hypothetical protein